MVRSVLLYSPEPDSAVAVALIARGWAVQVATTSDAVEAALAAGGIELVVLDDPPLPAAKDVVALVDACDCVPARLWLSTWPEAPIHSGRLGVDALVLDPSDVDAIVEHADRILAPRPRRRSTGSLFALGSSPGLVPPRRRDDDDA